MCEVLRKLRHSKIDQECLISKVKEWKEQECEIYFRPKGRSTPSENTNNNVTTNDDDEATKTTLC